LGRDLDPDWLPIYTSDADVVRSPDCAGTPASLAESDDEEWERLLP
jgi:hypothetical protein